MVKALHTWLVGRTYQQASELRVSQAHYPLDVVQLIFIVSIPGVSFWALPQNSGGIRK